jgi:hypothetical protein
MDEKELGLEEFNLDDIMKEFGSGEPEQEAAPAEEAAAEDVPDAAEEAPEAEEAASDNRDETALTEDTIIAAPVTEDTITPDPVTEDTIVVPVTDDTIVVGTVTEDTIRLDNVADAVPSSHELEDTRAFAPVEADGDTMPNPDTDAEPEPFSGEWEPRYDEPMGEYIPPQPIIFRPKSRLRELKRKLIAGPEKRYYELAELGVGKLQAAIFLSLLLVVICAGITVFHGLGLVQPERMKLMIFSQFFVLLFAALLGCYQMMDGVVDIFKGRFSLNSLLFFTFILCCADGVFCLNDQRIPCCAAFSLQVTMSLLSTYHKRTVETAQMDTMRKAVRLDKLNLKEAYFEGQTGILRSEGQVEDFMDTYAQRTKPEKAVSIYALLALIASIAIGITAFIMRGAASGVQAAAVSLLAAAPASFFVCLSRPMAILQKRLHKVGTVLCGWQGVEGLCQRAVFPLDSPDLFPAGSTKMNGMKFYGTRDPDQIIAYATAIITATGGGLVPLFEQLLDSRNGRHYDVDSLRSYGAGGIGGEVNGEPVLLGELNFMKDMGVEVPEGIRVNQAVYVSVDGELCALFAITYQRDRLTAAGLGSLCSYRKLGTVLTAGDFMLTESFIRSKFGVKTRRMSFPERNIRLELRNTPADEDAPALALMTQSGLAGMAYAVTGARTLRGTCRAGLWVHILAGCVGLGIMLTLTILGATYLLTPVNMFVYQLGWLIPGLIVTEWTRAI